MSLLTTPQLVALYNNILKAGAHEYNSKTFWSHLIRTGFIKSEDVIYASEIPPTPLSADKFRRVDFGFYTLNRHLELQVVALGEIKRATGSIDEVEAQLQEACQACVMYTKEDVWGIAMKGTMAQVFQHTYATNQFFSITGDKYIDANSPNAGILANAFTTLATSITQPVQSAQPVASSSTPADGWYPANDGTNRQRYYQSGQWTNHYDP
ncbi:hypothetical protein E8E12_001481 [Didymella heteroderae]|uniref:DUF2510 domain-containing protein n=1 Tax=Didymella heteroderae TaxID=1769908 RepID=A0A9P4WG41_9PLEO|nr:hypothetical protein E8E12_001481 [Didymella heteroderae]